MGNVYPLVLIAGWSLVNGIGLQRLSCCSYIRAFKGIMLVIVRSLHYRARWQTVHLSRNKLGLDAFKIQDSNRSV